jgi:hypothetical protein
MKIEYNHNTEPFNEKAPFSPFAKFNMDLAGYELQFRGKKIFKWEAWAAGYKSLEDIFSDKCEVKAIKLQTEKTN